MPVDELLCALSFEPSEYREKVPRLVPLKLLDLCKPLIEITSTGEVDFVHFSAKE